MNKENDKIELTERERLIFQAGVVFGMDKTVKEFGLSNWAYDLLIPRVMARCKTMLEHFPGDWIAATKELLKTFDGIVASEKKRRQEYYDKNTN